MLTPKEAFLEISCFSLFPSWSNSSAGVLSMCSPLLVTPAHSKGFGESREGPARLHSGLEKAGGGTHEGSAEGLGRACTLIART